MYKMSEFRTNMRKAFNDADNGHEVVVERYGQKYQLVSLVEGPMPGSVFESPVDYNLEANKLQTDLEPFIDKLNKVTGGIKTCKHGSDPALCKFAKIVNGKKVCK